MAPTGEVGIPRVNEVCELLCEDEDPRWDSLWRAFEVATLPWDAARNIQQLTDAYATASFFYAISKDLRRHAEDKVPQQFAEDMMEALVKVLDKYIMAAMVLAKHGGA